MAFTPLPFSTLPWTAGGHPLEQKKALGSVALLRFAPGFADPNWCPNGHLLLVLEGRLQLEFPEQVLIVSAGEGCQIDAGTVHRASNPGDVDVILFIASNVNGVNIAAAARPTNDPGVD